MALGRLGSTGPTRLASLIGVVAAVAVLASGCAPSNYSYVSSSDRNAYFKVPSSWKFFDKREILVATGQSLSGEADRQLSWMIGFDADPKPSLDHLINIAEAPKYPVILARVESMSFSIHDQLSLRSLRNVVYPVDRLLDANAAEILSAKDIVLKGGFHGSRLTYDVALQGLNNPTSGADVIRVTQVAVVNAATTKLYLFTIRCESHCYRDNKTLLDQIADSWTVKER
jgi:hypothetical protein